MDSRSTCSSHRKLALFTHYFPAHRGGVEIVAEQLAIRLVLQNDISISWFSSDTDVAPCQAATKQIQCFPQPTWNWVERAIGIPWPIWSPSSIRAIWGGIKSADIVHLHDYIYAGNILAFVFAKLLRRPTLVTQHIGLIPYKNPLLRFALWSINWIVGKSCLQHADKVVFISPQVQKYFSRFTYWKKPPIYLANGVDSSVYFPMTTERNKLRKRFGLDTNRSLILFVGRFTEKKGLLFLHALAESMPDIQWAFAGHGVLDPCKWQLPNVKVFENLANQTLAPLYCAADLLVLPSKGEGFPLVVQEAMSCGLPCMVSDEVAEGCPAAVHLLIHERCAASEDLALWSLNLRQLLSDDGRRKELGKQCSEFALLHWNWDVCANEYAKLIRSLADKQT